MANQGTLPPPALWPQSSTPDTIYGSQPQPTNSFTLTKGCPTYWVSTRKNSPALQDHSQLNSRPHTSISQSSPQTAGAARQLYLHTPLRCCCQIARHFKVLWLQCLIYLLNVCTMPNTMGSWLWQGCPDTAIINCNYGWLPKSQFTSWARLFPVLRGRRAPPECPGGAPHPGPAALLPTAGAARGWWAADKVALALREEEEARALSSAWGPSMFNGGSAKIFWQSLPEGSLVASRSQVVCQSLCN